MSPHVIMKSRRTYPHLLSSYPVKMLQHGYNASDMAPYLYEASGLSTTIALQCEVARVSNRYMRLRVIRSQSNANGKAPSLRTTGPSESKCPPAKERSLLMKRCSPKPSPSITDLVNVTPSKTGCPQETSVLTKIKITAKNWLGRLRIEITHVRRL